MGRVRLWRSGHWEVAVADGLFAGPQPGAQAAAVEALSQRITQVAKEGKKARAEQWRRSFREWCHATVSAAGPALRAAQASTAFSAADIRAEWLPVWSAPPCAPDHGRAWGQLTAEVELEELPT